MLFFVWGLAALSIGLQASMLRCRVSVVSHTAGIADRYLVPAMPLVAGVGPVVWWFALVDGFLGHCSVASSLSTPTTNGALASEWTTWPSE